MLKKSLPIPTKSSSQHWVLCKQGWTLKLRLFASLYFGSGWTEFCWALVVNLYFYFFIGLQFRAGQTTMPCLHKALDVACKRMDTFQLTILFSLLTSAFFIWKKPKHNLLTKFVTFTHFLLLILTIVVIMLLFNNYRLIGTHSNTIVGATFLISGILLFGLTRNKIIKIYSGIIFSINLIFQIALLFAPNGLLLFYAIACFMFQSPYMTKNLTVEKNIEFYEPFLGPPPIYLTEKKFGILKSQKLMVFQKGEPYYKPDINNLKIINDTTIECNITLNKDNTTKDTLITK